MPTLFISDLHLSHQRPEKIRLFERMLAHARGGVEALYILGDLFEVWVGDDDDTAPHPAILAALKAVSAGGTPLYVMRGNRDFLLGRGFESATGCRLLDDTTVADLHGRRVLLMHGDTLCTRDLAYQAFRRKVRDIGWQRRFLSKPLWVRKLVGRYARLRSCLASRGKSDYVMDVDAGAVDAAMRAQGVSLLIHGHTHRPAIHEFHIEGQPARRIVLGDWYEQDSVLVCDRDGERLLRVSDYLGCELS